MSVEFHQSIARTFRCSRPFHRLPFPSCHRRLHALKPPWVEIAKKRWLFPVDEGAWTAFNMAKSVHNAGTSRRHPLKTSCVAICSNRYLRVKVEVELRNIACGPPRRLTKLRAYSILPDQVGSPLMTWRERCEGKQGIFSYRHRLIVH